MIVAEKKPLFHQMPHGHAADQRRGNRRSKEGIGIVAQPSAMNQHLDDREVENIDPIREIPVLADIAGIKKKPEVRHDRGKRKGLQNWQGKIGG